MSGRCRLLIVGAGGRTGGLLTRLAIDEGHSVTALLRNRQAVEAIPDLTRTVVGDATDPKVVADAVANQDAVITVVAAPNRKPTTIMSDITTTVVGAMKDAGSSRLVITSSRNLTATTPWWMVRPVKRMLRHVYTDLARAEDTVRSSGLDWTIVRAVMLTDDPPRGAVHIDRSDNATGGDWKLSRGDFARALLDTVNDPATIRQALGVNGHK